MNGQLIYDPNHFTTRYSQIEFLPKISYHHFKVVDFPLNQIRLH